MQRQVAKDEDHAARLSALRAKLAEAEEIQTLDLQHCNTNLIRRLPLMTVANAAKSPCKSLF
jgi:hypothetical protein